MGALRVIGHLYSASEGIMARLTKRKIDAAIAGATNDVRLWDDDPRGLGIRIKPTGAATFFIQYTSPVTFKKVRHSIDQYGRLTLDQARDEAKDLFRLVAKGEDPAFTKRDARHDSAATITVAEFCEEYMRDAEAGIATFRGRPKKQSTLKIDRGRIDRHIKPTLGRKFVREVTRQDVERAMHDIRLGKTAKVVKTKPRGRAVVKGGAGTAKRCIAFLSAIFSYAEKLGIRPDNPVRGIELRPDGKRDRVLSPEEYRTLGEAFEDLVKEGANPDAIRAYQVLALTGCRKSEIFALKKSEIDTHNKCLRLADTKTGQQVRAIGSAAIDLLNESLRGNESAYVFSAVKGGEHMTDVKVFQKARAKSGLADISLHTLRHSFASVGLELEYSEMTIGGILGHRSHSVTARYAHHVDRSLVAAAERISLTIAQRLDGKNSGTDNIIRLGKA